MTAIEKLRKLLTGKMPNGKTRAEACADSFVNCALTIGDCAELLQEIERLRGEASGAREPSAEVEAIERCVHCGVKLEIEGDAGHCLSCTCGGQQP